MFKAKKILIFFFAILLINNIYAQKISEIDSLKQILEKAKEEDKPEILNKLSWSLRNSTPEESVKYGKEALILAKKYDITIELAKAYGFLGVAYRNLGNYPDAFDNYFKGLKISETYGHKEQEGYANINIGNLYIYQESYKDAVNYLNKAIEIAKEIDNQNMLAYCNLNIGRAFLLEEEFDKSLEYFNIALEIRTTANDLDAQAVCHKYIGDAYLGQQKTDQAFESYNVALKLDNSFTDKDLLADTYSKLAEILIIKNKILEAKKYAEISLEYSKIVNNKFRIRNAYKILSEIEIKLNNFEKATINLQNVLKYNDSLFNQRLSQKLLNIKYSVAQEKKQAEIDLLNKENEIVELKLKRKKTFEIFLILALILMSVVIVVGFVLRGKLKSSNKKLNIHQKIVLDQKEELEQALKEQERLNQQFFAKNIEVEQRNIEIKAFSENLKKEKEKVEIAHKKRTESINYAKRIQESLITSNKLTDKYLKDYFIVFKPLDLVSGDFYYVTKINKYLIFAVADCTGHGVPGAFITMLGITYLNTIINNKEVNTPADVLNILREDFKKLFDTFGTENQNGLDIALCVINTETDILQYAGAYNPLWIVRNNELLEYKATQNPIGAYLKERKFENNEIELKNNDVIYIASDGYQDQFDENGQKLTKKRFKNLLIKIHSLPLKEQKKELETFLKKWKGGYRQIDDITVMGIRWTK